MGSITYRIDEKNKTVYTYCRGYLTIEDLLSHSDTVISDPKFQKCMNSISDVTEAEFEYGFTPLLRFLNHLKFRESIRGDFKWAIIFGRENGSEILKLFQILATNEIFSIKLFEKIYEAERWVSWQE